MEYRRHRTSAAMALILSLGLGTSLDSTVRLACPTQDLGVAIRALVETIPGPAAARAPLIAL